MGRVLDRSICAVMPLRSVTLAAMAAHPIAPFGRCDRCKWANITRRLVASRSESDDGRMKSERSRATSSAVAAELARVRSRLDRKHSKHNCDPDRHERAHDTGTLPSGVARLAVLAKDLRPMRGGQGHVHPPPLSSSAPMTG